MTRSSWLRRASPKSSELNGEYRAELRNKRTMLSKVQADLHHVHATLDGAKEAIDNLKWNRQQLAAQVPDGGSSSVGETERLQLANSLRELGELLIAREALVEEMMKMVDKVDIKGALVRAGGVAHKEEVFSHASTELDAKRAEIAASISSQAELMARIARENDIFNAAKSSDDANNEREKRLRNLSDAVNAFETIVSDIKHIQLTLTELDRKADTFKNDVSGYIVAREMTREEQVMVRCRPPACAHARPRADVGRDLTVRAPVGDRTSAGRLTVQAPALAAGGRGTQTRPRTKSLLASCSRRWRTSARAAAVGVTVRPSHHLGLGLRHQLRRQLTRRRRTGSRLRTVPHAARPQRTVRHPQLRLQRTVRHPLRPRTATRHPRMGKHHPPTGGRQPRTASRQPGTASRQRMASRQVATTLRQVATTPRRRRTAPRRHPVATHHPRRTRHLTPPPHRRRRPRLRRGTRLPLCPPTPPCRPRGSTALQPTAPRPGTHRRRRAPTRMGTRSPQRKGTPHPRTLPRRSAASTARRLRTSSAHLSSAGRWLQQVDLSPSLTVLTLETHEIIMYEREGSLSTLSV